MKLLKYLVLKLNSPYIYMYVYIVYEGLMDNRLDMITDLESVFLSQPVI